MERRLPGVPDGAAAVAMATLRTWMRAPELRMMMLTPIIMLVVTAGMLDNLPANELLRALMTAGIVAFLLVVGLGGPIGNQFAFDRAGFRALVLSPASRRDVLLGKNLAMVPHAVLTTLAVISLTLWRSPMRLDHLAATIVQAIPMFVVICVAANLMSIVGPLALKPGSGMPAPHQGIRNFYPIVFVLLIPIPVGLTLAPLGIEALLGLTEGFAGLPSYLALGIVQAAVFLWLYRIAIAWQGRLLQRREQQILNVVASRTE
jgi:hypothetical protein